MGQFPSHSLTFKKDLFVQRLSMPLNHGKCSKNNLAKLETIQNMASKIALGLHAQCPSNKVKHLTGLPSILERRNTVIIKYYSRIQAIGYEHDVFKLTFAKDDFSHSLASIRLSKTFNLLVPSWKLDSPCFSHFLVPPGWLMSPPSFSLELIPFAKDKLLANPNSGAFS